MKTFVKSASIMIFAILGLNCSNVNSSDPKFIDETFHGLWAETEFIYRFRSDGTFELETKGHYSFDKYPGTYFLLDNILYLTARTEWQVFDGVLKERLKLIDNKCLRDRDSNFYCVSIDELNERMDQQFSWEEEVTAILDSLPVVKEKRAKITLPDEEFYERARFRCNGIIKVNNQELYHFAFTKPVQHADRTYLNLFVQKAPFKIYLYNLPGNSLTLLQEE
jgi:hypothetical protein